VRAAGNSGASERPSSTTLCSDDGEEPAMPERWICRVVGHRYDHVRYPDSDVPEGYFLRCRRCGHEREEVQSGPAPSRRWNS
jgi:hypothetical protein